METIDTKLAGELLNRLQMSNHAFVHFLNKRRRSDSPFFTFFVLVGVVWRRSFIPGHCQQRGRGELQLPFISFYLFLFHNHVPPAPPPPSCNKKLDVPSNLHFNAFLFLSFFYILCCDSNIHLQSLMDVLADLFESYFGIGPLHPL